MVVWGTTSHLDRRYNNKTPGGGRVGAYLRQMLGQAIRLGFTFE